MTVLVTAAEMRAFDRHTIETIGVPGAVLMETAGRGVAEIVRGLGRRRVVVVCGAGNNGGDGFVVARWLHGWELDVSVLLVGVEATGDAALHLRAARAAGVEITETHDLPSLTAGIAGADVLVDAVFGTGLTRPIEGFLASVIGCINDSSAVKVAVDIPSGLDSDRGVPVGVCVQADHTITFGFRKRGLVVSPGFTFAGQVHLVDIGIPAALARGCKSTLLDDSVLDPISGALDPLGHKGTHGHLLLLAGSLGKAGAAALSGRAALRTGAGLVTVAVDEAALPSMLAVSGAPELMTLPLSGDAAAQNRALSKALEGKRAVAAGPGLAGTPEAYELLRHLVAEALAAKLPLVLDADALNHLALHRELLPAGGQVILTPHPGEAARLVGKTTLAVQADRVAVAQELAQTYGAVVALKGARTLIAAPDGRLAVCPTGNAGMGTGGTGDVLTGCMGALLASGSDIWQAATAGVYLHGAAGDWVAATRGQRGLVAGDVIDALPAILAR